MKEYKVIKDFYTAKKGDVFTYDEEDCIWKLDVTEDGNNRFMGLDDDALNMFIERGNIEQVMSKPSEIDFDDRDLLLKRSIKLAEVHCIIDSMLKQYDQDYTDMMEKANNGEIQPCVKVESETVYYNICKVLTALKEVIEEEA